MTRPESISLRQQLSKLPAVQVLIVCFVLSYVALGVFSFYFLRRIDRTYSELLQRSVPILNDLHDATALAVYALHWTNPLLYKKQDANPAELGEKARIQFAKEKVLRAKLESAIWFAERPECKAELEAAGADFARSGGEVIGLLAANRTADATEQREKTFRPALEHYISVTGSLGDLIEQDSKKTSEQLTAETNSRSILLLSVASWPFILLVVLTVLTAILMVMVAALFRGSEVR